MKWTSSDFPRKIRGIRCELAFAAAMALGVPAMAADHYCTTAAQFSAALTNASLNTNDTITLQAGTNFTGPAGGFVLPNKTGTGWITIRSSNLASLPAEGTRVNPTHAGNMPKILSPAQNESAITTATSAHHFKLVGLEVIGFQNGTNESTVDLISLGTSGAAQDTVTEAPKNIVIDRCIIRAASTTHKIKRGIALNSVSTDVTNCYISGFKLGGSDSQAICGWNGPGPFNIINNYLEGAGENVMFGGAHPSIPNLVPSDVVIQKNYFSKPLTWNQHDTSSYAGVNYSIKNIFEIKNGRNFTIEGNIFERMWVDSQPGWGIVFTPATDAGVAPWTVVENVTFRNNIFRHMALGNNILGHDADGDVSEQTTNITYENNLFYDLGGSLWGGTSGQLFLIHADVGDITINHNTAFNTDHIINADAGAPHGHLIFTNNVVSREGGGGVRSNSFGEGISGAGGGTLPNMFSSYLFTNNVIKSGTSSRYPTGNFFPSDWSFLVDKVGGDYVNGDWDIASGHAYNNAGTDGKDLGADMPALIAATAGCVSGVWSGGGGPSGLIAYDGFNYTAPGNLNGQNGGSGFANAWTAVSGQGNPATAVGSLSYIGGPNSLTTVGNMLAPSTTNQSVRNFTSAINAANSTKWVSFRIKRTVAGTLPTNHVGFPLYPSTGGGGTSIFLGKPGNASNWGIDIGGTVATASGTPSLDAFLLYKLVFTSTQVTASMWVNPSLASESGLGTAHAVTPAVTHGGVLSSMKMSTGANSTSYQLDEFRIGGSFADVTPGTQVEVIVDNPAATLTGTWTTSTWTGGGQFEGTNYVHDGNAGKGSKTCRWTPTVPATGSYEVFAKWTSNTDRTTAAPYAIQHAGGTANVTRNQQSQGGTWVSLGTWTFNSGTGGNVLLSNGGTTGFVIADAVRFVKQ